MTLNDVFELSIPQLEYVLDGCAKNNKDVENATKNTKTLEGAEAVQYLIDSGETK